MSFLLFKDIFVPGEPVRRSQLLTPDRKSIKTGSNQNVEAGDRIDLIFITTATSRNVKGLMGSYEQDIRRGIYHFTVGADRGPLQTITFTEMENKQAVNENFVNSTNRAVDLVSTFVQPQDVTMTLKGNNLLATGAFIFIDATAAHFQKVLTLVHFGGPLRLCLC